MVHLFVVSTKAEYQKTYALLEDRRPRVTIMMAKDGYEAMELSRRNSQTVVIVDETSLGKD